jgi:acyl-CoA synthetase (NDP forming)/RimJ/RimL family protein N-acetyltransferase
MVTEPLVRDVILRDGSTLRLRGTAPQDFDDIKAFYDALSPESRHLRFHGYGRTDSVARDDAEADGTDRVALIGRHGGRVVAAARYDRLREPGAAEVAFAVADDFHGRGTATRMLEQLAEIAADGGIDRFDAEVMADNRGMLTVFKRAGFDLRRTGSFGEVVVSLDIRPTEAVRERIEARDHRAAVASLRPILAPQSIALVIGSSEPRGVGAAVLGNIVADGFTGVVTPVGRSGGVMRSMRVVPGLSALDEVPELVVIAAPAAEALDVASEAAEQGAQALMVLSSGFAETGDDDGREREEQLLEIARSAGMRMIGPNCLGVLNTDPGVSLNATFAGARVPRGRVAICAESGAIGIALLGHVAARGLGVSGFASLGNRADVSTNDLLELWEEDEHTSAVMLYVETFGNPERFARIAGRVARRKPILAVKGQRTPPTVAQPRSHTAAALRGDVLVDALLRPAGVMRFRTGDELFNAAQFFESQPLPRGRRTAIVSNSAGVATLVRDACATLRLAAGEVALVGIHTGRGEYAEAVRRLTDDAATDAVIACYVDLWGGRPREVLNAISETAEGQDKPVVSCVVRADGRLPRRGPRSVPNFLSPESCAAVLAGAAERRDWLARPLGQRPELGDLDAEAARARVTAWLDEQDAGDGWMPTAEAEALLATHGIPFVPARQCASVEEAVAAARELGGAIALKADFPPPAQAGDVDAVMLGLEGGAAVQAGWEELVRRVGAAGRKWTGAVVQPLVEPGADVLVGALAEPSLGTVMAVGLGGRQAGLGRDVAFRLPPVTDVDAGELIDAARGVATQLDGFRGSPALDREALRDLILRFTALLRAVPELVEADINPVRCMTSGCTVIDLRLRAGRPVREQSVKTW